MVINFAISGYSKENKFTVSFKSQNAIETLW